MPAQNRYDVAVIGAGQAGLTMGYQLARQRRRFVILEPPTQSAPRGERAGTRSPSSRRGATTASPASSSPATPTAIPAETRWSPTSRATRRPSTSPCSSAARSEPSAARTAASGLSHQRGAAVEADQVVVATGPFQVPRVPALAADLDPTVFRPTASATATPVSSPTGRCSSWAAATPASRSPRSSQRLARPTSRSDRARCRFRSGSAGATSSGGSASSESSRRASTRSSAAA